MVFTLLCVILWIIPAGLSDLSGPDETRYVLVAREWLAGDNPLALTLHGRPYDQKPPLAFILIALMLKGSGGEIASLAVRLPSILLGTAGVLATWMVGRRLFGSRAGFLAGLVLATSPQWMIDTLTAELNVSFSGWITLSLACWFLRGEGRLSVARAAAMWALAAAAFFTKGPLAILVIVGVLLAECGVRRSFSPLQEAWLWQGLMFLGTLVAGWLLAQDASFGPSFVKGQVAGETIGRFLHGDHQAPFWFYPPRLFASIMFPWALLLVPVGLGMARGRAGDPPEAWVLALGWVLLPLLVLTLASGKRESYMLPLLPGLSLLVGRHLDGFLARGQPTERVSVALSAFAALLSVALAACSVLLACRPRLLAVLRLEPPPWAWGTTALLAVVAASVAWCCHAGRARPEIPVLATAALLLLYGFGRLAVVAPALDHVKSSRGFAEFAGEFLKANNVPPVLGLLDRASKPEYHVYGRYERMPLKLEDVVPGARDLPAVIAARAKDWDDPAALEQRMAWAGYALAAQKSASGDMLALYARVDVAPRPTVPGCSCESLHALGRPVHAFARQ